MVTKSHAAVFAVFHNITNIKTHLGFIFSMAGNTKSHCCLCAKQVLTSWTRTFGMLGTVQTKACCSEEM